MPSAAEAAAAKRAQLLAMQKEMEELERAEKEEEEAKKREEERIRKEAEELEKFRRKEREARERQKIAFEKAKAEKAKKRTLEESDEIDVTVGSFLEENGVTWGMKEGKVCTSCRKADKKCFWRMDPARGKACYACTVSKKICKLGGAEQEPEQSEPGPSKRRKVTESKGKGKEKIGVPAVSGSVTPDVWEKILSELRGMKEEVVSELRGLRTEVAEVRSETHKVRLNCEFLAQRVEAINFDVRDLANLFDPVQDGAKNEDEGAGQGSAENTENAENEMTEIEETLQ